VADGVDLVENDAGGVVVLWGMPTWCWEPGDVVGRRLAAVQLVETGAAARTEVAAAFGVSTETARRWSRDYERGGAVALGLEVKGPKRASKLTGDKKKEIRQARSGGRSMTEVAEICGVSLNSVSRALRGDDPLRPGSTGAKPEGKELVPLAAHSGDREQRFRFKANTVPVETEQMPIGSTCGRCSVVKWPSWAARPPDRLRHLLLSAPADRPWPRLRGRPALRCSGVPSGAPA
jgi:transposase